MKKVRWIQFKPCNAISLVYFMSKFAGHGVLHKFPSHFIELPKCRFSLKPVIGVKNIQSDDSSYLYKYDNQLTNPTSEQIWV